MADDSTSTIEQLQAFVQNIAQEVARARAYKEQNQDNGTITSILENARSGLDLIIRDARGGQGNTPAIATLGDVAKGYWETIAMMGDATPTGFGRLDSMLGGGLHAGRMIVLASPPGGGKTTISNQIAYHISNAGVPAVYVSTEDTRLALLAKTISRLTRTHYAAVVNGWSAKVDEINKGLEMVQESPAAERLLYIESDGGLPLPELRRIAVEHFQRFPADACPLIVCDYLQRMARAQRLGNQDLREAVSRMGEQLHDLARDLGCTVLALSSMNRASYAGTMGMAAPKESGDLEYSSDVLATLEFEATEGDGKDAKNKRKVPIDAQAARLSLLKNRLGPVGSIEFDWFAQRQEWAEAAK